MELPSAAEKASVWWSFSNLSFLRTEVKEAQPHSWLLTAFATGTQDSLVKDTENDSQFMQSEIWHDYLPSNAIW